MTIAFLEIKPTITILEVETDKSTMWLSRWLIWWASKIMDDMKVLGWMLRMLKIKQTFKALATS